MQRALLAYVHQYCGRNDIQVAVSGDVDVENIPVVNLKDSHAVVIRQSQAGLTVYDGRIALPHDSDPIYPIKLLRSKTQVARTLHKLAQPGGRIKIIA